MKKTRGEKLFYIFNCVFLGIIALLALYPFVYVLSASMSSSQSVVTGKVILLPHDINFDSYAKVLSEKGIWIAYLNTFYYTIFGVIVNLILTICGAYALSKKRVMGRTAISFFIALTMWFQPGMIPTYLNFRDLNMLDSRFTIIIGFAITTFYVFLMRTFFQSIPEELEEAAKVDGANDLTILWKVYLPLSKASLVTIGLFYAVHRWNGYFWTMILLSDEGKVPLQVLLKKLIVEMNVSDEMGNMAVYSKETIIYATIIVSIIPIVAAYPFIQKYFVKGTMIGSVKG
ncbi:sugar ABC transporter permease [Paenibacillus sp. FSL A5-0031]|uniref:carbohydrate ABC transporter permease n=1 Tax=Paenibacillus sp. FSL A5-0031 TaxID=1920420 RepID=UPI00096F4FB9|nr:carbohydrate ABC transporter permease [Paenibacillus sp. FSL A5-0031]OME77190.1 sugar ABC transporter permease [Paenibacillus sp. FSL A5-0031]